MHTGMRVQHSSLVSKPLTSVDCGLYQRRWTYAHRHKRRLSCNFSRQVVCSTAAEQQVVISGSSQEDIYELLVDRVLAAAAQGTKRMVVGIAGVPGSGKSTTADEVVRRVHQRLNVHPDAGPAIAVSMDGYHYYRRELDAMQDPEALHARRGAHWTFNAEAFVAAMRQIREAEAVTLPSFQHGVGDPVEAGIEVLKAHTIVLVEGNYVLLDVAPWDEVAQLLDDSWYVDTDIDTALDRLLYRQMNDNKRSEEEVRARIANNDRPNAELVHAASRRRAKVLITAPPALQPEP